MGAICQIGVFTAERSIFLVQKRSFSAFSHYVLSETPPDVFAQKRPILNGQLCRVFLCIFPTKNRVFCQKNPRKSTSRCGPQNGPKSAPFPCENANLTNGTSFVFLGNLKPDFPLKWIFLARFGLKCLILQFFWPKWAKLCTVSLRQRFFR